MTRMRTLTPRKANWEPTDDVAAMTPAQIIKLRREQMGMQQGELALLLGYGNPNFISMLEMGWSFVPIAKAPEVAEVLRLPKHWFVERAMATSTAKECGLHAFFYGQQGAARQAFEVDLARAAIEMGLAPSLV